MRGRGVSWYWMWEKVLLEVNLYSTHQRTHCTWKEHGKSFFQNSTSHTSKNWWRKETPSVWRQIPNSESEIAHKGENLRIMGMRGSSATATLLYQKCHRAEKRCMNAMSAGRLSSRQNRALAVRGPLREKPLSNAKKWGKCAKGRNLPSRLEYCIETQRKKCRETFTKKLQLTEQKQCLNNLGKFS